MDRRIILAGIAALAAAPVLAQGTGASPAMPAGSAARPGAMGQAEMQHMQETMRAGALSLETSRLGQQKASNANLKQFAGFEVAEQTTIAEVLRSMMDPSATSSTAATQGAAAPGAAAPAMDAKGREMMQKLTQASGEAFDREYLTGQIEGHRELLQIQERYLQSNPQNREHMNVAKLARGHIRDHIALLQNIQQIVK